MKKVALMLVGLLFATTLFAQVPINIYSSNGTYYIKNGSAVFSYSGLKILQNTTTLDIYSNGQKIYYCTPSQFLDVNGKPYGTTVAQAFTNFAVSMNQSTSILTINEVAQNTKIASLSADSPHNVLLFSDDFNRPNTTPGSLGLSVFDGKPYDLTGLGAPTAQVQNGLFVSPSTAGPTYASKFFNLPGGQAANRITRVTVTFSFTSTPQAGMGLAMITSSDSANIALNNMNHWVFSGDGTTTPSIWIRGAQNTAPTTQTKPLRPQVYKINTPYTISMTINDDRVHVRLPDGQTIDERDSRLPLVAGNRVIWEPGAGIVISYVSVYQSTGSSYYSPVSIPGGISSPLGLKTPAAAIVTGLAVGDTVMGPQRARIINNNSGDDALLIQSDGQGAMLRLKSTGTGTSPRINFATSNDPNFDNSIRMENFGVQIYRGTTKLFELPFSGPTFFATGIQIPNLYLSGSLVAPANENAPANGTNEVRFIPGNGIYYYGSVSGTNKWTKVPIAASGWTN